LRAYPYPALSAAPDVPGDLASLALAIDADVGAFHAEWSDYTPAWTASTSGTPSAGTGGAVTGSYTRIGKTVHVRCKVLWGTAAIASAVGNWQFSLPVPGKDLDGPGIGNWVYRDSSSAARYTGVVMQWHTGNVLLAYGNPVTFLQVNQPVPHDVADTLHFAYTYQAA
jgi:hypothetical protein